jgi:hypothetical protein
MAEFGAITPQECLAATTTSASSPTGTYDSDFLADFDTSNTVPYTGTCATPLQTGNRPWWHKSGYDPYDCGSGVILLNWTTYCCNGNVIDLTQVLNDEATNRYEGELCFENMRCCSGDPAVTIGAATSCTAGTEASMLLESSLSTAYWSTACMPTTSEDNLFASTTSQTVASETSSSIPNAAQIPLPAVPLFGTLLLLAGLLR